MASGGGLPPESWLCLSWLVPAVWGGERWAPCCRRERCWRSEGVSDMPSPQGDLVTSNDLGVVVPDNSFPVPNLSLWGSNNKASGRCKSGLFLFRIHSGHRMKTMLVTLINYLYQDLHKGVQLYLSSWISQWPRIPYFWTTCEGWTGSLHSLVVPILPGSFLPVREG